MGFFGFNGSSLYSSLKSSMDFWFQNERLNFCYGCAILFVLLCIILYNFSTRLLRFFSSSSSSSRRHSVSFSSPAASATDIASSNSRYLAFLIRSGPCFLRENNYFVLFFYVDAFFLVIFHFCYWCGVCVELGLV